MPKGDTEVSRPNSFSSLDRLYAVHLAGSFQIYWNIDLIIESLLA